VRRPLSWRRGLLRLLLVGILCSALIEYRVHRWTPSCSPRWPHAISHALTILNHTQPLLLCVVRGENNTLNQIANGWAFKTRQGPRAIAQGCRVQSGKETLLEFLGTGEASPAVKAPGCEPNDCHHPPGSARRSPPATRPPDPPAHPIGRLRAARARSGEAATPPGVAGPRSPAGRPRSGLLRAWEAAGSALVASPHPELDQPVSTVG